MFSIPIYCIIKQKEEQLFSFLFGYLLKRGVNIHEKKNFEGRRVTQRLLLLYRGLHGRRYWKKMRCKGAEA